MTDYIIQTDFSQTTEDGRKIFRKGSIHSGKEISSLKQLIGKGYVKIAKLEKPEKEPEVKSEGGE